jgi:hypothetical protein
MGTLKGFPCPPALWLRRAKPAYAYAIMETLKGFPNPRAMVRGERSSPAPHAIMGTPMGPPPDTVGSGSGTGSPLDLRT